MTTNGVYEQLSAYDVPCYVGWYTKLQISGVWVVTALKENKTTFCVFKIQGSSIGLSLKSVWYRMLPS